MLRLIVMLALIACATGCHGHSAAAEAGVEAGPPAAELPFPFTTIRIGTTEAELKAMFPPVEDIAHCAPKLVGGDAPTPPQVPGAEKNPRSRCARALDIGGMTSKELSDEYDWLVKAEDTFRQAGRDATDFRDGDREVFAQIRGSIRAGTVPEAALIAADRGKHSTAYSAVGGVETDLLDGATHFAEAYTTRRTVCALISDGCDDLDPDRVTRYVSGGYTLGQIDADAHSRVVYGKCRGPFLQGEKKLQPKFLPRAGGLAGIGLARASRADHQLNPEDASTFSVYTSRSKLDQPVAKFGVLVANALPQTEGYWTGAIVLLPGEGVKEDWGSAIVWLRDGKVARVLVNIADNDKLGDLPKALAALYGSPGTTQGTLTTWSLAGGITAKLDIGAAVSLVVESPGSRAGSTATATTTATGTGASSASTTAAGTTGVAQATTTTPPTTLATTTAQAATAVTTTAVVQSGVSVQQPALAVATASSGGGAATSPFNPGAANASLGAIAARVTSCKRGDGPTGTGHAKVTFQPDGTVSAVEVDGGPFAGTTVGTCIAGMFRAARVTPFAGAAVTVGKSFRVE